MSPAALAEPEIGSPQQSARAPEPAMQLADPAEMPPPGSCEPLPAVGSFALLSEDNTLATDAVNAYLRQGRLEAAVIERICSVTTDFGRIYTAYDALYGAAGGDGLGDGESIQAAGTMVQTPENCWILLPDGGSGPYQLDPLPRSFMYTGQRVELTLSGPLQFANLDQCPFPAVAASDARIGDWQMSPTDSAVAFEPVVRAALAGLGIDATVTVAGTLIRVTGLNRDQVWPLQESLRDRYGQFMLIGDGITVHIWPAAEAARD